MASPSPSALPVVYELMGRLYSYNEWEALCDGCGQCCFESHWTERGWNHTSIPCRYLDDFDRSCKVYSNRFQAEKECIKVTPSVVLLGGLPETCAYREEVARIVEEDFAGEDPREKRRSKKRNGSRKRKRVS